MVNISDYAGEVVGGDWAPAILAAIVAIPNGGTIVIDADVTTASPVVDTDLNYINITIQGDGEHILRLRPGIGNHGIALANKAFVTFRDLLVFGYPSAENTTAECLTALGGGFCDFVMVDNCLFAGVYADRAIVEVGTGQGVITRSKFGGCGGIHIKGANFYSLDINNVACVDYQNYNGLYYDRQGARDAWIQASSVLDTAMVNISNLSSDEGAALQVDIDNIGQVLIANISCNLGSGEGIDLTNVRNATLLNNQFTWTIEDRPAVNIRDCGDVTLDGMRGLIGPRQITKDPQSRVTLRNSPSVYMETVVPDPAIINVALAVNGGTVTASATNGGSGSNIINGIRLNSGGFLQVNGSGGQWVEVDFGVSRTITDINFISATVNEDIEPTLGTQGGFTSENELEMSYWNGSSWVSLGVVDSNRQWKVWSFGEVATTKVRLDAIATAGGALYANEFEVIGR
jgi:hypothetical protein